MPSNGLILSEPVKISTSLSTEVMPKQLKSRTTCMISSVNCLRSSGKVTIKCSTLTPLWMFTPSSNQTKLLIKMKRIEWLVNLCLLLSLCLYTTALVTLIEFLPNTFLKVSNQILLLVLKFAMSSSASPKCFLSRVFHLVSLLFTRSVWRTFTEALITNIF